MMWKVSRGADPGSDGSLGHTPMEPGSRDQAGNGDYPVGQPRSQGLAT